jgi:O-antigen ligase
LHPSTESQGRAPTVFAHLRAAIRSRYAWIALLLFFAICFIPDNRTGATNLYRLLVVVPMLLCFRPADLARIWQQTPARWFLLLCAWLTLTLLWDGLTYKDFKLLLRELNVLALLYLVYLIGTHHPLRIPALLAGLVVIGLIGAALILRDWPEGWKQHAMAARGVFNHHVTVGWALAMVTIVALYQTLNVAQRGLACAYGLAGLALGILVFWVQARGAYVVLASGILLLLALFPGRRAGLLAIAGGTLTLILVLTFHRELATVAGHVVERGTAGRLAIWHNGWEAITGSWRWLWFGHGLSADSMNPTANIVAMHYHNLLLNQAFYAGLIGVALYLGWLASLLRAAVAERRLWLWAALVVAMQAGFITDGDQLWVNPSSMLLAFLLPAFLLGFRVPAPVREDTPTVRDASSVD